MTRFDSNEFDVSGARRRSDFFATAGQELARARSAGGPAVVMVVEVKGLLGVHLALGEPEARTMAADAAGVLLDAFGEAGLVGRLAHAEFAVYLDDDSDAEEMRSLAIRLAEERAEAPDREWRLVLCIGAAATDADAEETLDELIVQAGADLRARSLGLPGIRRRSRASSARA
jgi:GGDEF domain-containing protein